jgi:hypothetical protein
MDAYAAVEHDNDEISFFDILTFLFRNLFVIMSCSVVGLLLAGTYLFVTPSVYEARLQIEMARTSSDNSEGGGGDGRGAPVEDAQLLVARLGMPSTYTEKSILACDLRDTPFPSKVLATQVQPKVLKGVNSVVEMTIHGNRPDVAKTCAAAIFEMIRDQQSILLRPFISEARETKTTLEARLKGNQDFLEKMDKTSVQSAVYLAKRDESLWLMNRIASIDRSMRQTFETRLVSPIYSPPSPVSPKKLSALIFGTFTGLLLGIFLAFMLKQISGWRTYANGN